jgi:hypothetical protein
MNPIAQKLEVGTMSIVLLFARIKGLATDPVSSAQPLKAASCVRPSSDSLTSGLVIGTGLWSTGQPY